MLNLHRGAWSGVLFVVTGIAVFLSFTCGGGSSGPTDVIPPATVDDLLISRTGVNCATLRWTAPGNDQGIGRASHYDLRYSNRVGNIAEWDSAFTVPDLHTPSPAGALDSATCQGLSPETASLSANMSETTSSPGITVEGGEDNADGGEAQTVGWRQVGGRLGA